MNLTEACMMLYSSSSRLEDGKMTPGGGAAATEIAMALREYATTVGGREQMAIEAFANAVEIVPKTSRRTQVLTPST